MVKQIATVRPSFCSHYSWYWIDKTLSTLILTTPLPLCSKRICLQLLQMRSGRVVGIVACGRHISTTMLSIRSLTTIHHLILTSTHSQLPLPHHHHPSHFFLPNRTCISSCHWFILPINHCLHYSFPCYFLLFHLFHHLTIINWTHLIIINLPPMIT